MNKLYTLLFLKYRYALYGYALYSELVQLKLNIGASDGDSTRPEV